MDRTERFYKISEMLRGSKAVSFATLLAKLEVSRSTLRRDLNYLSTRLNNPIVYCHELGGYRLEAADTSGQQAHELPGLWFSPTEIHALLTMQHLVAGLDAGGLLTTHIAPLMVRLNALLGPEGNASAAQLRQRVRIISLAQRSVRPRHFEQVATALAQRKRLHIAYTARGNGNTTEREVSPYTDHRELIMDILKHGTHCEVLGPASLRRVVGDEVKKFSEKYF